MLNAGSIRHVLVLSLPLVAFAGAALALMFLTSVQRSPLVASQNAGAEVGFAATEYDVVEGLAFTVAVELKGGEIGDAQFVYEITGLGTPQTGTIDAGNLTNTHTFIAPDDGDPNTRPDAIELVVEKGPGSAGDVAAGFDKATLQFMTVVDQGTLAAGGAVREATVTTDNPHLYDFVVEGTARQFVILQATGNHPRSNDSGRVRGRLFDSTGALLAQADDLARWSGDAVFGRHRYFRIERWLDPGNYVLEVRPDEGSTSEAYGILADIIPPGDINTLSYAETTVPAPLTRDADHPHLRRSVPYYYRLEVAEELRGVTVTIDSAGGTANSDPVARLLDGQGGFIAESDKFDGDTTGNMFRFHRMLEPGTHYLAIQSFVDDSVNNLNPGINGIEYQLSDPIGFSFIGPRTVGFAATSITAPENGTVMLTVQLTDDRGPAHRDITLNLEYSGGGHTGPATAVIPNGENSATIQFRVPPNDGVAGTVPPPLTLTLGLRPGVDDVGLSSADRQATITFIDRDLALDRSEVTGELTQADQIDRWYLTAVPDGTILVVQSFNDVNVRGRLLAADGVTGLKSNDNTLNQRAFRITHRVTGGDADFILEVSGDTGIYGLFAEEANVVGTVEYNAPEGTPMTIDSSILPYTHYYRVIWPPATAVAGRPLTVSAASGSGDGLRVELLRGDGTFIAHAVDGFSTMREIMANLPPGEVHLLAVNGGLSLDGGNLNQDALHDYVVNLRGPEIVGGFAADDVSRTVPENEPFALTVALADGLGVALRDVTLDVAYSGGGGYTGPATVTIPAGASSAELQLRAPGDTVVDTTLPPLTVTLSNPSTGSALQPDPRDMAEVTFTDNDPLAEVRFVGNLNPTYGEGEMVTLRAELQQGVVATRTIVVQVVVTGVTMTETTLMIARDDNFGEFQIELPDDTAAGQAPAPVVARLSDPQVDDPSQGGVSPGERYNVVSGAGSSVTITVADNDAMSLVGFDAASHLFTEGGPVTVRLGLRPGKALAETLTVMVAGVPGRAQPLPLTLTSTDVSQDITFTAPNDRRAAPPGDVALTIVDILPRGIASRAPGLDMTTVSFRDDGDPVARVGFRTSDRARTVNEIESVELAVELQDGVPATRAIRLRVSGFGNGPRMITIPQRAVSASLTFTAPGDGAAGMAPDPLELTLTVAGNGDEAAVDPSGARAVITIDDPEILLLGPDNAVEATVTETGTSHRWHLQNVPDGILVVQSFRGQDVKARLFAAGGVRVLKENDDFLNQISFRITHRVTRGPADFILEVEPSTSFLPGRPYGLFAEVVDVVGTVEYNRPEGPPMTIEASDRLPPDRHETNRLPITHYYRVVVPAGAVGQAVTVRVDNPTNAGQRFELLTAGGEFIDQALRGRGDIEITRVLDPGEYLLVVNGGDSSDSGNLMQGVLPDYVVTLRGPDVVRGFAPDDVTRTVPEDEPFALTVAMAPGLVAGRDLTLDVGYSGGSGYTGPDMVTIPSGEDSAELQLQAPGDMALGVVPDPLTVSLSNPPVGSVLQPGAQTATITFTDNAPVVVEFAGDLSHVYGEGEPITLRAQLRDGVLALRAVSVGVNFSDNRPSETIMINRGENSVPLTITAPEDATSGVAPETLTVTLTTVTNGVLDTSRATVVIAFVDNDEVPLLGFERAEYVFMEGERAEITLLVRPGGQFYNNLPQNIRIAGVPGFVAPRSIFLSDSGNRATLNFRANDFRAHGAPPDATLRIVDDLQPDALRVSPGLGVATVRFTPDDDDPVARVGFRMSDRARTVDERASVELAVELQAGVPATRAIDLLVSGINPSDPSETRLLTIPDGANSASLTFTAPGDGVAGTAPDPLNLTLTVAGGGDEAVVDPNGARAVITIADLEILTLGPENAIEATLSQTGPSHRWHLRDVPDGILVVQSFRSQDVKARLFAADGALLKENDRFLNQVSFRITHLVTGGPADFIIEVEPSAGFLVGREYGLFAEVVDDVVGTVEYNRPAGPGMTIEASDRLPPSPFQQNRLPPAPHYYRVVVPPEAAGQEVTVRAASDSGDNLRAELLDETGTHITVVGGTDTERVAMLQLGPGEYLLAVSGGDRSDSGNLRHTVLRDYVVTLRGPEIVQGFAADDISRTVPENEPFSLTVALAPGTGMAINDVTLNVSYEGNDVGNLERGPPTVTIPAGETSAELTLRVVGDGDLTDTPDGLVVRLSNPSAGSVLQDGSNVATITFTENDQTPSVGFDRLGYRALENSQVEVRLVLNKVTADDVVVMVTISPVGGPAIGTRMVTIAGGETSALLELTAPDDDVAGATPPIWQLRLSSATNADIDQNNNLTILLLVDDDRVKVGFATTSPAPVTEGEMVTLNLELKEADLVTADTRRGPATVTVSDGMGFSQAVTIAATETSTSFSYRVPDDTRARAAPAPVTLTLSAPVNSRLADNFNAATITLSDDNDPVAEVGFAGALNPTFGEGEQVMLTAQLQDGVAATRTISVRVDLSGSATGDRLLTIAAGANSGSVRIGLPDDDIVGSVTETTVTATLIDGPPGGGTGGNERYDVASGAAAVAIAVADNDATSLVGFDAASYAFTEGETVTITLGLRPGKALTKTLDVKVTGVPGRTQPLTLTLTETVTASSITFTAPDDDISGGAPADVALTIVADLPTDQAIVAPGLGMTTVSFRDDGDPVARAAIRVSDRRRTVDEGASVELAVELQDGVAATRAINLLVNGVPIVGTSTTETRVITIQTGTASALLTFTAPNDGVVTTALAPLVLTLEMAGAGDEAVVDPSGARAVITIADREILTRDRSEVTGELKQAGQVHRWHLLDVPDDTLLVVQSFNRVDVVGRLLAADGTLLQENDDFLNNRDAFRITHRVRVTGTADLILEVRAGADSSRNLGTYGLFAENANVVGTLEYNRPEGSRMDIPGSKLSKLPFTHYYRVFVPPEAAGRPVTMNANSDRGHGLRIQLLEADGNHIVRGGTGFGTSREITRVLVPGEYLLAVNGGGERLGGNLNQRELRDYVAILRGPEIVQGFAADDLSRAVPENEPFMLTVALAPGTGIAINDVTLDVAYSGGSGYTGPATVTIPEGRTSAELQLMAPGDTVVGTMPTPLTVTLSNPSAGSHLQPGSVEATVTFTENDPLALVGFADPLNPTFGEGEMVTLRAQLPDNVVATRTIEVRVDLAGGVTATRSLTIATGTNSGLIQIALPDDDVLDVPPPPVVATLIGPPPGDDRYDVVIGAERVTITITDNDKASLLGFEFADYVFTEGEEVTVRVGLRPGSRPLAQALTVMVMDVPGRAQPLELTLTPTEGSQDITFTAPDDDDHAPPAPVVLTIVDTLPRDIARLVPGFNVATVRFTDDGDPVARVGFRMSDRARTVDERAMVELAVELQPDVPATRAIALLVHGVPVVGTSTTETRAITIPRGATSALLTLTAPHEEGIIAAPDPLALTLGVAGNGDEAVVDPNGARAVITIADLEPLTLGESTGEEGGALDNRFRVNRWHLQNVPDGALLVVQSFSNPNLDVRGRLLDADSGMRLREVNNFLNQNAFRITHLVEGGPANFILEVRGDNGRYGLLAEVVNVLDTVEYNRPATTPMTIDTSTLPTAHYYRVVVPPEAAGQPVTVNVDNPNNDGHRVELLEEDGRFIANALSGRGHIEITRALAAGEYLLVVNGRADSNSGNLNQRGLRDYVVTLRGPEFVGFAADDQSRTVEENELFTLTVALAPGTGMAINPVTLDVAYSGGDGYMGPTTVTIPAGAASTELELIAPITPQVGTMPPPLTVTLSNPSSGFLLPGSETATVTFMDAVRDAFVGFAAPTLTATEGEQVTLAVQLAGGVVASRTIQAKLEFSGNRLPAETVQIEIGATGASLMITAPDDEVAHGAPAPLTVTLTEVTDGRLDTDRDTLLITFVDDNDPVARIGFRDSAISAEEGDNLQIRIELEDGATASRTIRAMVTFSDNRPAQPVEIADGSNFTTLTLTAPNDEVAHGTPDPLTLTLTDLTNALPAANVRTVITVTDEGDPVAAVGFTAPTLTAMEKEQVTLSVALAGSVPATRAVMVTVSDGMGFSEMVTIAPGTSSTTFNYPAPDDQLARVVPPPVTLTLSEPDNGAVDASRATLRITLVDNDPVASIGFRDSAIDAVEGGNIQIRIELQRDVDATRTIRAMVTFSDGRDAVPVQIAGSSNFTTLTLTAPDDLVPNETPDQLTLRLTEVTDGNGVVDTNRATLRITFMDNDSMASIGFREDAISAPEGETVTLTVQLAGGAQASREINVLATFSDGTMEMVTIGVLESSVELAVKLAEDAIANVAPPPLTVTLSDPVNALLTPGATRVTITVTDDDPLASVGFAPGSTRDVAEGERVELTVGLDGGVTATRAITVRVTFSDDRAPQTLTIAADGSSTTLTLDVSDDEIENMPPVTLTLTLSEPNNAVLTDGADEAVLTVLDNDRALLGFAPDSDHTVVESSTVTLTIQQMQLGELAMQTVSVMVLFSDGRPSEMVTIDQGQPSADFTFEAPGDVLANIAPPDLVLTLSNAVNADVVPGTQATIKLEDDDPVAVIGFATSVLRVREGEPVRIRLELADGVVATRTISHDEMHVRFGPPTPGTVQGDFPRVAENRAIDWGEIPAGGTFTEFTLTMARSDNLAGTAPRDELYVLHIPLIIPPDDPTIRITSGFVDVSPATNRLTLIHVDDDVASVGFAADDLTATADEGGQVSLTVELKDDIRFARPEELTVNLSGGITETLTLTIPAGSSSEELAFPIPDDNVVGGPSPITVTLATPGPLARLETGSAVATVTVNDNDVAAVGFADVTDVPTIEGERVELTVQLAGGVTSVRPVSVTATFSGASIATQTVTIAAGDRSAILAFTAPDDDIENAGMHTTLTVTLSDPVNATLTADTAVRVTVTVADDDIFSLGFDAADLKRTVSEGEMVTLSVGLVDDKVATQSVSVLVTYSDGRPDAMLEIESGSSSTLLSFAAPADVTALVAPPVLIVTLSEPAEVPLTFGFGQARITITDDDPLAEVGFAPGSDQALAEGETATLRVILANGVVATRAISVTITFSDARPPVMLEIENGANSAQLELPIPRDNVPNLQAPPLTLTLAATNAALPAGTDRAVVTALDVDLASVGFADGSDRTVAEGANVQLRLELANGAVATRAVSVVVSFSDNRAPQTVTIATRTGSTLFTVRAPDDSTFGETPDPLTLTLTAPVNGALTADRGVATITVTDNDRAPGGGGGGPPPQEPDPPRRRTGGGGGGGGPTLQLTVLPLTPAEVREGDSVIYTITRTDAAAAINVQIRISGSTAGATPGDLSTVETVEIPAGTTSIEHTISALLDERNENAERFAVTFTPVDERGTALGPPQRRDLTVTNREPFGLEAGATALMEGDVLVVSVSRPQDTALNRPFNLSIQVQRSDSRGAATDDLTFPTSVTLAAGERVAEFRVQALRDELEEPEERFNLTVSGAGTIAFTVADRPYLPGTGGVALGWAALAALLALALLAATGGTLLLRARRLPPPRSR